MEFGYNVFGVNFIIPIFLHGFCGVYSDQLQFNFHFQIKLNENYETEWFINLARCRNVREAQVLAKIHRKWAVHSPNCTLSRQSPLRVNCSYTEIGLTTNRKTSEL